MRIFAQDLVSNLPTYALIASYVVYLINLIIGCRFVWNITSLGKNTANASLSKAADDMLKILHSAGRWVKWFLLIAPLMTCLVWFFTPAERQAAAVDTFRLLAVMLFVMSVVNHLLGSVLLGQVKSDPCFPSFKKEVMPLSVRLIVTAMICLMIFLYLSY